MEQNDKNWIDNINKNGFHIQNNYFNTTYLTKINEICNKIIKFDCLFNKFGLGNQTYRNGNIFTGNLLYKNKIFYDLLINKHLLNIPKQILNEFILSEYKLITSYINPNFKYWWHRDHPYNLGIKMDDVHIGILIPLMDFNENVGSTLIIPKSHLLKDKPHDLNETKFYNKGKYFKLNTCEFFL